MTPVEAVHLAAAFVLGLISGVALLIWAQVREVKRWRAKSALLDRRPSGAPPQVSAMELFDRWYSRIGK